MTKEKLERLVTYLNKTKSKLTDALPEKHKHRPKQYKDFLEREISFVSRQIEESKLEMGTK